MNKRILILIPLLFLSSISLSTTDIRTVERIIDGDTIVLKGGERVRYIGIDTPEMNLNILSSNEFVRLQIVSHCNGIIFFPIRKYQ